MESTTTYVLVLHRILENSVKVWQSLFLLHCFIGKTPCKKSLGKKDRTDWLIELGSPTESQSFHHQIGPLTYLYWWYLHWATNNTSQSYNAPIDILLHAYIDVINHDSLRS